MSLYSVPGKLLVTRLSPRPAPARPVERSVCCAPLRWTTWCEQTAASFVQINQTGDRGADQEITGTVLDEITHTVILPNHTGCAR